MCKSMFFILASILAILGLSGCGGGGGGGGSGASPTGGGSPLTLTPIKGIFRGSCNVSISNTSGQALFSGTPSVAADGTVSVSLPSGASGPFVITISGSGTSCQYYNDNVANPQWITMPFSSSLNALVPTSMAAAGASIAVTSLTEMAFQAASAAHGGNVSNMADNDPAINQGIVAALNLAGASSVSATDFLKPPAQIPQPGLALTDRKAIAMVSIANMNERDPIAAVRAMSLKAAEAAQPAKAATYESEIRGIGTLIPVAGKTSFSQQIANQATVSPATQGAGQANSNASANQTAAASSVAQVDWMQQFLKEASSADGLRRIDFGLSSPTANQPAIGHILTAALSNAAYSLAKPLFNLASDLWSKGANSGNYVLGKNGWVDQNSTSMSFTLNPDQSLQVSEDGYGSYKGYVTGQDLNGVVFASAVAEYNNKNAIWLNGPMVVNPANSGNSNGGSVSNGTISSGSSISISTGAVLCNSIYGSCGNASSGNAGAAITIGGSGTLTVSPVANSLAVNVSSGITLGGVTPIGSNPSPAATSPAVNVPLRNMGTGISSLFSGLGPKGQWVIDANAAPTSADVVPAGAFSSGATAYNFIPDPTAVASQDIYTITSNPALISYTPATNSSSVTLIDYNVLYDINSAKLVSLPAPGSVFCIGGNYYSPAAAPYTYNVRTISSFSSPCSAPPSGTPLLGVASFIPVQISGGVNVWMDANSNAFLAVVDGAVHVGWKTSKGAAFPGGNLGIYVNKQASDQLLSKLGLPLF